MTMEASDLAYLGGALREKSEYIAFTIFLLVTTYLAFDQGYLLATGSLVLFTIGMAIIAILVSRHEFKRRKYR